MRIILILLSFLFLLSCETRESLSADLTIVNANILTSNKKSARTISESLLKEKADIYILIEAHLGQNVDSTLFKENGYSLYDITGRAESGNMVLASKIGGLFDSFTLSKAGLTPPPFGTLRFPFGDDTISLIGVHTPSPYHHSKELVSFTFSEMKSLAFEGESLTDTGSLQKGDMLLLAGDFNSFPNSNYVETIMQMGFEDAAYSGGDPYQFTWSPKEIPTKFARIDYLFHHPEIGIAYQEVLSIPGSDHSGLKTGLFFQ